MKWDTKPRDSEKISTGIGKTMTMTHATGSSIKPRNMRTWRIWSGFLEKFRRMSNGWSRFSSRTLTFVWFLSITLTLSWPCQAGFAAIPTDIAVKILIGEACDQGSIGMQAVAEVVRRRNVSAFSTLQRKDLDAFIAKQVAWYKTVKKQDLREMAQQAWEKSAHSNLTQGATLYENVQDFGFPKAWDPQRVRRVAMIGKHTFFQEVVIKKKR